MPPGVRCHSSFGKWIVFMAVTLTTLLNGGGREIVEDFRMVVLSLDGWVWPAHKAKRGMCAKLSWSRWMVAALWMLTRTVVQMRGGQMKRGSAFRRASLLPDEVGAACAELSHTWFAQSDVASRGRAVLVLGRYLAFQSRCVLVMWVLR